MCWILLQSLTNMYFIEINNLHNNNIFVLEFILDCVLITLKGESKMREIHPAISFNKSLKIIEIKKKTLKKSILFKRKIHESKGNGAFSLLKWERLIFQLPRGKIIDCSTKSSFSPEEIFIVSHKIHDSKGNVSFLRLKGGMTFLHEKHGFKWGMKKSR